LSLIRLAAGRPTGADIPLSGRHVLRASSGTCLTHPHHTPRSAHVRLSKGQRVKSNTNTTRSLSADAADQGSASHQPIPHRRCGSTSRSATSSAGLAQNQSCAIETALLERVSQRYVREGQRSGALRFGDSRVMARSCKDLWKLVCLPCRNWGFRPGHLLPDPHRAGRRS
jgi:hypothetical protein